MNDLLSNRGKVDDLERGNPSSVEMNSMKPDQNMAQFFDKIELVKAEMDKVKQLLNKLQDANEESKGIQRADAMRALRDRMDSDIGLVTKSARFIKVNLEEIDASNAANRKVRGCEAGSATDRTRMNVTNNQRKKLKDLMDQFQGLRAKMTSEYKETIERRYYTVTGQQADEETIENMIRTGESETFLQQAIREQGRGHVIETIREIQERHDAVKELEKHLMELHSIFMDISVLVDAQGQLLNDIEANVAHANSFTRDGVKQLAIAKRHQRSKRKCIGCTIILLIIVLIIVLIIILKVVNVIK